MNLLAKPSDYNSVAKAKRDRSAVTAACTRLTYDASDAQRWLLVHTFH